MRIRVTSVEYFDLNVALNSIDVDDVVPPIIKLRDAKCHASLVSSFLLKNSLCFDVNEMIGVQKLAGNFGKMIVVNLGRQHHRYLDSYFMSS
jgi:hypothetical protein